MNDKNKSTSNLSRAPLLYRPFLPALDSSHHTHHPARLHAYYILEMRVDATVLFLWTTNALPSQSIPKRVRLLLDDALQSIRRGCEQHFQGSFLRPGGT
jgi:hypothetical protein